jgi:hypothetical protein
LGVKTIEPPLDIDPEIVWKTISIFPPELQPGSGASMISSGVRSVPAAVFSDLERPPLARYSRVLKIPSPGGGMVDAVDSK